MVGWLESQPLALWRLDGVCRWKSIGFGWLGLFKRRLFAFSGRSRSGRECGLSLSGGGLFGR
jgi:hypothetical protein